MCNTCNSFVCRIHAKSDADIIAVRPATAYPNVTLWTHAVGGLSENDFILAAKIDGILS